MYAHSVADMFAIISEKGGFDHKFYLTDNPDVAASDVDPLFHYLEHGFREGRKPTPYFDPRIYLAENPDVAEANVEPFFHYTVQGMREGRRVPSPPVAAEPEAEKPRSTYFDAAYYLSENPDVAAAKIDPEAHYRENGEREGRKPNALFDPVYYAQVNPDVVAARLGLFQHFKTIGYKEGRLAANASGAKVHKSNKNILFIGHDAIEAGAQRVLLETVKWFSEKTDYNVYVALCAVGRLVAEYCKYADVFVFDRYTLTIDDRVRRLIDLKWSLIYANTVRTGKALATLLSHLKQKTPIIAHLHELEDVLDTFKDDFVELIAHANYFVVVNDGIAELLERKYDVPRSRIGVQHPFIRTQIAEAGEAEDVRAAARREIGIPQGTQVVVGCGTAYRRKGIDLFVGAGLDLLDLDPDLPVTFVWIGGGDDLGAAMESVADAGHDRHFRFPGHRSDASRLIAAGDLFFLSSREDPFPLVCLEAAQYAIPVLHFDRGTGIGAFTQATADRVAAGVQVAGFSTREAALAMRDLLRDDARRRRLGDNGQARVFASYSARPKLLESYQNLVNTGYLRPSVSVIVPNYNHEKFIAKRVDSIVNQSLASLQVILLDDASRDASPAIMERYVTDPRVEIYLNASNSGSPFRQWAKGLSYARADVVWIAESDDLAEEDFCGNLIGFFRDPSVSIATGKVVITDENGAVVPNALDPYYDSAELNLFRGSWKRDGDEFIRSHFGSKCTLVNASAMLLRKDRLAEAMPSARSYSMCGDWLIYLKMLHGAKIAFSEASVSYFRRHSSSTVHAIEGTPTYFTERAAIAEFVTTAMSLSRQQVRRILHELETEWARFAYKNPDRAFEEFVDVTRIRTRGKPRRGVVGIYIHGILFSKGGIERLGSQLASYLCDMGYRVILYCLKSGKNGAEPVYALREGVKVQPFDIFGSNAVATLSDFLRRDEVDVFVPMLSESLFETVVEAGRKAGVYIIVSEHNDPWQIEQKWWSKAGREQCFTSADSIHLLLPTFARSLPAPLRQKVVIIPNGVELGPEPASTLESKQIVCVARLADQKRIDLLVKAFRMVLSTHPDWRLLVVGNGERRDDLEDLVERLGLGDTVSMPGVTDQVGEALAASSIFVLPSEFEGFGIVILEAQRAGLPCIAFRKCNGPNVLIEHLVNGLLVEEFGVEGLAEAINRLIEDEELRSSLGASARESVAKYALPGVLDLWEDHIRQALR